MNPYLVGACVIGARIKQTARVHRFVLGMYDISSAQHQMDSLKQPTNRAALALLKGGQTAINGAIKTADAKGLPGPTERKNVQAHLQWHADLLAKLMNQPNALYPSGDDLKKYVMEAFVDANAVEEGAAYIDAAWDQMWQEIAVAIQALPAEVRHVVTSAANNLVEGATGIPLWGWGLIAAGLVVGVGYLAYKVATGPVGGAVAKHYLG
jgi:hypothetical protein